MRAMVLEALGQPLQLTKLQFLRARANSGTGVSSGRSKHWLERSPQWTNSGCGNVGDWRSELEFAGSIKS
jgi:hypothetical protein